MNDRDKLIIEGVEADTPKMHDPKCPKCNHAPLQFACNIITTGMGHAIAVIWCGQCGHTMATQFVGMAESPLSGPRIVRPS